MANSLSTSDGKSFFKDGKVFEKFCLMPKADREKLLNGEPVSVPEVDEILEEVKEKAKEHKKKEKKK